MYRLPLETMIAFSISADFFCGLAIELRFDRTVWRVFSRAFTGVSIDFCFETHVAEAIW